MPSPARPELHAHLDARAGQLWPALGALGSGRMFTRGEHKSQREGPLGPGSPQRGSREGDVGSWTPHRLLVAL